MKINTRQSSVASDRAIKNYLWLALPSLSVIAAVWFDWLPWLRGNSEWQWPLRANVDLARAMVPLLTLAVYVALGAGGCAPLTATLCLVEKSAFSCCF